MADWACVGYGPPYLSEDRMTSHPWPDPQRLDDGAVPCGPGCLATPFEHWCERVGTRPEAFGAWEAYQSLSGVRAES